MNVLRLSTIVTKTQIATTPMDLSCALAAMDILEMELFAKVNRSLSFCNTTCTLDTLGVRRFPK
jgi:hypothetical protein